MPERGTQPGPDPNPHSSWEKWTERWRDRLRQRLQRRCRGAVQVRFGQERAEPEIRAFDSPVYLIYNLTCGHRLWVRIRKIKYQIPPWPWICCVAGLTLAWGDQKSRRHWQEHRVRMPPRGLSQEWFQASGERPSSTCRPNYTPHPDWGTQWRLRRGVVGCCVTSCWGCCLDSIIFCETCNCQNQFIYIICKLFLLVFLPQGSSRHQFYVCLTLAVAYFTVTPTISTPLLLLFFGAALLCCLAALSSATFLQKIFTLTSCQHTHRE